MIHLLAAQWDPHESTDPFELLGPIGLVLVVSLVFFTVVIVLGYNHRKTLERRRQEYLALQRIQQQHQQNPPKPHPPLH